ncbi:hypothetical protein SASPL_121290 [Salvia splendens]|uniref:Uncharacterized protein n=1 Tax=Salvia splendens TaxID=180675 RepID=A0A8X8ZWF3_SALSN|nr:hypothetical protein SASPL_121290 [Salvia splendens]
MDENGTSKMCIEAEGGKDSYCLEMFCVEVESVKQDVMHLERLYNSLQESNEDIKKAENSGMMRDIPGLPQHRPR